MWLMAIKLNPFFVTCLQKHLSCLGGPLKQVDFASYLKM